KQELFRNLAKSSKPELLAKLQDPDPWVRLLVASVIAQKRIPAGKVLVPLLGDPSIEVREAAHQVLVQLARGTDFGPAPLDAQPKVQQATQRWNTWLVWSQHLPLPQEATQQHDVVGRPERGRIGAQDSHSLRPATQLNRQNAP